MMSCYKVTMKYWNSIHEQMMWLSTVINVLYLKSLMIRVEIVSFKVGVPQSNAILLIFASIPFTSTTYLLSFNTPAPPRKISPNGFFFRVSATFRVSKPHPVNFLLRRNKKMRPLEAPRSLRSVWVQFFSLTLGFVILGGWAPNY